MRSAALAGCVAALAAAVAGGVARASIFIAANPAGATLRVDARGDALVTWRGGSVLVPPHGQLFHGGALAGADASRRVTPTVPLALVQRRTPDGRLWALQAWRVLPGGPVELHLARWTGAPTQLTLATDGTRLTGTVSFHGKPVTGTTTTLEGKHPRIYVYLDCFACGGGTGWKRMLGLAPKVDGSFAVAIQPQWTGTNYRATVAGPNAGVTFAPDARAAVAAGG